MRANDIRRLILALTLLGALLLTLEVWNRVTQARVVRISTVSTDTPFFDRVTALHGSAVNSGVKVGDVIDTAHVSPGERYRWWTDSYASTSVRLLIRHGSSARDVIVASDGQWSSYDPLRMTANVIGFAGFYLMLFFAGLLIAKRPGNREAQLLSLLLIGIAGGVGIEHPLTRWPLLDVVLAGLSQCIFQVSFALLATYAMQFARPPSRLRYLLTRATYAGTAAAAVLQVVPLVSAWTGRSIPNLDMFYSGGWQYLQTSLSLLLPLTCVLTALAASRGAERTRISWAAASIGLYYLAIAAVQVASTLLPSFVVTLGLDFAAIIAPLGLSYSLLGGRLLDTSFALNRAIVFSTVSIIVVGLFALIEWLLARWLEGATHTENLVVSGAIAIGLGFSIRAVHGRVEHIMDELFFRKRHEDEAAIRRFADEAAYITDRTILLERTHDVLTAHADARTVQTLLDDGRGSYGTIGENDPAIVTLRAAHAVVDLHDVTTALVGEFAFPMVAQGQLVGILVLGPKNSGTSYAPDESQAIAHLAGGVGGALRLIAMRDPETPELLSELLRRFARVEATIFEMHAHLRTPLTGPDS